MKKYGDELFIYAMAQRELKEKKQAEQEQNKKQEEKQEKE